MNRSRFIVFLLIGALVSLAALFLAPTRVIHAAECFLADDNAEVGCDPTGRLQTFAQPAPVPDSFLPDRRYGKLADYANVHAEPSFASPVIRNVGDGFLFVTVHGQTRVDGVTWYLINGGEWVPQNSIKIVEQSAFQGLEVNTQPQRPFGWVVADFYPSDEPDGEPNEDAPRIYRYTFIEVYDAVYGEDGWIWYDIGLGRWMKQTFVSLVDYTPRPIEVGPDEFWVEIDLYEQTMAAYEGDRMVYASLISSGLNRWPTREGIFQVFERTEERKMSGAEGQLDYYFVEDVPHTMYFDELMGIALHGAYWHDRFGYKHSHGCVNMPPKDAEWTYLWSSDAPNALWVWVHTSDPNGYFGRQALSLGGA